MPAYVSESDERAILEPIIAEVAKKTGLPILPLSFVTEPRNMPNAAFTVDWWIGPGLLFISQSTTVLTRDELSATIAHEYGHYAEFENGDYEFTSPSESEDNADLFAIKHGYGDALLAEHKQLLPIVEKRIKHMGKDGAHRAPKERIQWLSEQVEKYALLKGKKNHVRATKTA